MIQHGENYSKNYYTNRNKPFTRRSDKFTNNINKKTTAIDSDRHWVNKLMIYGRRKDIFCSPVATPIHSFHNVVVILLWFSLLHAIVLCACSCSSGLGLCAVFAVFIWNWYTLMIAHTQWMEGYVFSSISLLCGYIVHMGTDKSIMKGETKKNGFWIVLFSQLSPDVQRNAQVWRITIFT